MKPLVPPSRRSSLQAGLLARRNKSSQELPFIVIAHNIRSLHNIGSLFRTADATGVSKIYCTGYSGTPDDPKAKKVSLGAEHFVPWEKVSRLGALIRKLKSIGYRIAVLEQDKKSILLDSFKPRFPLALILGNEVRGSSRSIIKNADTVIEISMRGKKESLNVSVAFGIAAFHIRRFLH